MLNLFKRAAFFTDIHHGLSANSDRHNDDCHEFIKWFIKTAKQENCDTCFFLGDWHHHRSTVNIRTLQYSLRSVEMLSAGFDRVFLLAGNHDQFYKANRDVHSLEWARHLPNVTIVNDWFQEGDVTIAPWLIGDDAKRLAKMNSKYLFGHFELPHFYMNSLVEMPDHGDINASQLSQFGQVFSGHFHKRQAKGNVWYIGNAFPHNFSDTNDDARGMMILEWGGEPQFHSWPGQPRFRVLNLSDVLEHTDKLLLPNTCNRINLDIDISFEEASFIKETLIPQYRLREMTLIPMKINELDQSGATTESFQSVDKIILDQLNSIESEFFDPKLLLEIYHTL